jgi:hypothetical protein
VALLFVAAAGASGSELDAVDRKLVKEPPYASDQPLYGLYAFGPQAGTRVWAVLDKSDGDRSDYDVLYFDRNGNGDLTEPAERITAVVNKQTSRTNFQIGDFTDPNTGQVHTQLVLSRWGDGQAMFLRLMWDGKQPVMGGYAEEPGPYTQFATSRDEAPVLWFDATGRFSFQRWCWKELRIGSAGDISVFMGHQGRGKNTFCAVSQDFLPQGAAVLATLIYRDASDKEQRLVNELKERC